MGKGELVVLQRGAARRADLRGRAWVGGRAGASVSKLPGGTFGCLQRGAPSLPSQIATAKG
jgi:hypothetical protein